MKEEEGAKSVCEESHNWEEEEEEADLESRRHKRTLGRF